MRALPAVGVEHTADALGALLARAAGYEPVWKQAGIDIDGPMGEHASGDEFARSRPRGARGYLLLQRTEEMMRASEAGARCAAAASATASRWRR